MALIQKQCELCRRSFFTAKRSRRCAECKAGSAIGAKHRRQVREEALVGWHTKEQWQAKIAEQKSCCHWCDRYLYDVRGRFLGTKDHVIPISSPLSSNYIENIVAACRPCNSKKGTLDAQEYEASISATSTDTASSLAAFFTNKQLTFEPWPEPSNEIAQAIAQVAASRKMEESILPFHGFDVFAKKRAIHDRRQLLRSQISEFNRRKA